MAARADGTIGLALVATLLLACAGMTAGSDPITPLQPPDEPSGPQAGAVESHGGGPSCDEAIADYEGEHGPVGDEGALSPDDEAALKDVLNRGSYLNTCEVSASASVEVCAAVVGGDAAGVTVRIDPAFQNQVDCVASSVRRMSFPSHEQMTQAKTEFEPSL